MVNINIDYEEILNKLNQKIAVIEYDNIILVITKEKLIQRCEELEKENKELKKETEIDKQEMS